MNYESSSAPCTQNHVKNPSPEMTFSLDCLRKIVMKRYGWFARRNSGQRIRNVCSGKEAGARRVMYVYKYVNYDGEDM